MREVFQGFEFLFPPETNKHETPPGVFGTKDMHDIFAKKKKHEKRESESSWERKDVSESRWHFIDTYCNQNPLLQLMKSVVACLFRHQLSEILDTPRPAPSPAALTQPTPYKPHPPPMDNMHGNLRFYYVQQPCLDYVLFLGVFEVISFSLSDISSGLMVSINRPHRWDAWPSHSRPESTQTCIPFSSHVIFRNTSWEWGGGLFHYG